MKSTAGNAIKVLLKIHTRKDTRQMSIFVLNDKFKLVMESVTRKGRKALYEPEQFHDLFYAEVEK